MPRTKVIKSADEKAMEEERYRPRLNRREILYIIDACQIDKPLLRMASARSLNFDDPYLWTRVEKLERKMRRLLRGEEGSE